MTKDNNSKSVSRKTGLPPGTLVHVGEKKVEAARISLIDYDEKTFEERQLGDIEECSSCKESPSVSWVNIDGIHQVNIIEKVGQLFDLHPLMLEDIPNTTQRPKFEDYDSHLFVVLKMFRPGYDKRSVQSEQVSIVLGQNFVISFQESVGDVFEPIRSRIRKAKGRIRKMGADYLAYSLIDAVVDGYFSVLEGASERIEAIDKQLAGKPNEAILRQIHSIKREMIFLRKAIWPLRELIGDLQRSESPLIAESTAVYLRDIYDHAIQVIDTIESHRDVVASTLDIYLSSLSNRMNAVMKVLTIIATIFIPLTFVAGIYGMNFKHMPELEWRWGYALVLLVMVTIAAGMIVYFKRKKWL